MPNWLARDIARDFPMQNWMVVALAIIAIWIVYKWRSPR
jgi:hypothetical protein